MSDESPFQDIEALTGRLNVVAEQQASKPGPIALRAARRLGDFLGVPAPKKNANSSPTTYP